MFQNISLILFCVLLVAFIGRTLLLRLHGIGSYHLANGGKISSLQERSVLLAAIFGFTVWFNESAFPSFFITLPISFHGPAVLSWLGIATTTAGVSLFCTAMVSMKDSWRVGIDPGTKTKLVINGVYTLSRNPAFLGFDLVFSGVFLSFPDPFTAAACIAIVISIHSLILKEEEHWIAVGGREYERYMKRVPRYCIPFRP
jgi:protein-S-isoprenylcysteine O-methyltransferase Ste14